MFTDRVIVKFFAGKGGDGLVAWKRAKFVPKGGPTGGNGGKGGSIILRANQEVYSLEDFRYKKTIQADNGQKGGPNSCTGSNGKDLTLDIPCGTLVKDAVTGEILHDFTTHGEKWILCKGGKGGRGNESFKSPTHQAPNVFTKGEPGEERPVELELKLIADIGLVGCPNAGKSTLISQAAKIKVKIAPYPFTTLKPNLGFIEFDDFSRIVIADIPGIIRGAHENRGLGFEFLKHIERTKVLVFLLDASGIEGRTPLQDFITLREELEKYDPQLLQRPCLIALNKVDCPEAAEHILEFRRETNLNPEQLFEISALNGDGLVKFIETLRFLAQKDGKRFI